MGKAAKEQTGELDAGTHYFKHGGAEQKAKHQDGRFVQETRENEPAAAKRTKYCRERIRKRERERGRESAREREREREGEREGEKAGSTKV